MVQVNYPDEAHEKIFEIEEKSFWFSHRNKIIKKAVRDFPPNGVIWDIGGGNGIVAAGLQEAGFETRLVEPSNVATVLARRRGLTNILTKTFQQLDCEAGSIAAVGLFDVLEHIDTPKNFLAKIQTVIKPEGFLYITVPAYSFLWSSEDDYAQHQRRYTLKSLLEECESAGFKCRYKSYFFLVLVLPIYFFRALPYRLFKSKTTQLNPSVHTRPSRILRVLLSLELLFPRLPFGSSCMAVFQKV